MGKSRHPSQDRLQAGFGFSRVGVVLSMVLICMVSWPSRTPAREFSDSLLRGLAEARDADSRIPILFRLSEYSLKTNLAEAADYAEESLRLSEGLKNATWISGALDALAKARHLQGRLDKAVECRERLFVLSRSRKDSLSLLRSIAGMAAIHISLGEYLRAQYLLDAAWKISEGMSARGRPGLPPTCRLEMHTAYGSALLGLNDQSNASRHFLEGMRLAAENGFEASSSIALLIEYGRLLEASGRSDSAKSVYARAYRLSRQACDVPAESSTSWALGGLAEKEGDFAIARSRYADAYHAAESAGSAMLAERSARSLAKVYQALGFADSSLRLTRMADEKRLLIEERKAAQELTRHDPIRSLKDPKTDHPSEASGGRWAFILSALGSLFLVQLFALRTVFIRSAPSRIPTSVALENGSRVVLDQRDVSNPERDGADANKMVPHVFSGIAFTERVSGFIDSLRVCMSGVTADRKAELGKVIREMERSSDESAWKEFEMRFNGIHEGFQEKLRDAVPNLTQNEKRLCLFLRMDMTTKEIARLTGQSIRAIELGRIRLRKKLNLTHTESNINDYLSSL